MQFFHSNLNHDFIYIQYAKFYTCSPCKLRSFCSLPTKVVFEECVKSDIDDLKLEFKIEVIIAHFGLNLTNYSIKFLNEINATLENSP
jgi:hypothetical protein